MELLNHLPNRISCTNLPFHFITLTIFFYILIIGGSTPIVLNPIPDHVCIAGHNCYFKIPSDTFDDTVKGNRLVYNVSLIDDSPLPEWLIYENIFSSVFYLGSYDTPGTIYGVTVVNDIAYIAHGWSGLLIIDVSNPLNPTLIASYDTSDARKVHVVNDIAYVADDWYGLQIIDVTNPSNPTLISYFNTPGAVNEVIVVNGFAYIADFNYGLQIIDVTNPSDPTLIGIYSTSFAMVRVSVINDIAYAATYGGVDIINVYNPLNPTRISFYTIETSFFKYGVNVINDTVYIATTRRLHIVNVTNPSDPTLIGMYTYNRTYDTDTGLAVVNDIAYIASYDGLLIINVTNPSYPTLINFYTLYGAIDIFVVNNIAYVAVWDRGLQIIDTVATTFSLSFHGIPLSYISNGSYYINITASDGISSISDTFQLQIIGITTIYNNSIDFLSIYSLDITRKLTIRLSNLPINNVMFSISEKNVEVLIFSGLEISFSPIDLNIEKVIEMKQSTYSFESQTILNITSTCNNFENSHTSFQISLSPLFPAKFFYFIFVIFIPIIYIFIRNPNNISSYSNMLLIGIILNMIQFTIFILITYLALNEQSLFHFALFFSILFVSYFFSIFSFAKSNDWVFGPNDDLDIGILMFSVIFDNIYFFHYMVIRKFQHLKEKLNNSIKMFCLYSTIVFVVPQLFLYCYICGKSPDALSINNYLLTGIICSILSIFFSIFIGLFSNSNDVITVFLEESNFSNHDDKNIFYSDQLKSLLFLEEKKSRNKDNNNDMNLIIDEKKELVSKTDEVKVHLLPLSTAPLDDHSEITHFVLNSDITSLLNYFHNFTAVNLLEYDKIGWTCLHSAIAFSDIEFIKQLLDVCYKHYQDKCKIVFTSNENWSFFDVAVCCQRKDVISLLLGSPLYIDEVDSCLEIVSHFCSDNNLHIHHLLSTSFLVYYSVRFGRVSMLKKLISRDPLCLEKTIKPKDSLLVIAVRNKHENIAKILAHHVSLDFRLDNGMHFIHFLSQYDFSTILQKTIDKGISVNLIDKATGKTPLHFAIENKCPENVKILLKNNADCSIIDNSGDSLLLTALQNHDINVLKFLLNQNVNFSITIKSGLHLIHRLSTFECPEILQQVIDQGISGSLVDEATGKTPLHFAIENKCPENVKILLKNNADCSIIDNLGNSFLTLALMNRNIEHFSFLPLHNLNFNIILPSGLHFLHEACKFECPQIIQKVIDQGVSPNITEATAQRTPLHFAMENGCIENTKVLFQNGAIETSDSAGFLPSMLARLNNRTELIKFLNVKSSIDLQNIIPSVSKAKSLILHPMDIDPNTTPSKIFKSFLIALKSNVELDFLLDTSKVRLSRKQITQIVLTLKQRAKNFALKPLYCGLIKEEVFNLTFLIQSQDFSLQRLSKEVSTYYELTDFQIKQTRPFYSQMAITLLALITSPYWLLLGLFNYLFHLKQEDHDEQSVDAFSIIFGVHSNGFDFYKALISQRLFITISFIIFGSLVILYPTLFISIFSQLLNEKYVYFIYIIGLILIIIIPLFIMQRLIWKDETLQMFDFPSSTITSITFRNCLAIFTIILDFVQLSALGFLHDVFHRDSDSVFQIFRFGILSFDFVDETFLFVIMCVLASIWMLICSYIFYSTFVQQPWLLRSIPRLNLLMSLLSGTLFLTMSNKLISILDCTVNDATGRSTLDMATHIECWTGVHILYSIVGTIVLILFAYTCSIMGPFFMQSYKRTLEIHTITAFLSTERFMKLLLSFTAVLLSNPEYRYIHIFFSLLGNILLLMFVLKYNPIDNIKLNQLKIILSFMVVWSHICYIIAMSYGDVSREEWLPAIFLFSGWSIFILIWLIIIYKDYQIWINPQIFEIAPTKFLTERKSRSRIEMSAV